MRGLAEGQKVSYEVEADRHSGKGLRPTSRAHKRLRHEGPPALKSKPPSVGDFWRPALRLIKHLIKHTRGGAREYLVLR